MGGALPSIRFLLNLLGIFGFSRSDSPSSDLPRSRIEGYGFTLLRVHGIGGDPRIRIILIHQEDMKRTKEGPIGAQTHPTALVPKMGT